MNKSSTRISLNNYKTLLNRNFILILIANMLIGFANNNVNIPVNKFAVDLGMAPELIGVVATIYNLSIALTRPFSGRAVDKLDNKKFIIFALIARIICFGCFAITNSVPMFIFSRVLHGVTFALLGSSLPTLAGKAVDKSVMATAFGVFVAVPGFLNATSAKFALSLHTNYGASVNFLVAAGFLALAIVAVVFVKFPEMSTRIDSESATKKKEKFKLSNFICYDALPAFCINLFVGAIFSLMSQFALISGEARGITTMATFFAVYSLAGVACRLGGGIVSDVVGEGWIIVIGMLSLSAACFIVAFGSSAVLLGIAGACYAIGQGGLYPTLQSIAVKSTTPEKAGIAISTNFLAPDIAGMITGAGAGFLIRAFNYTTTFCIFGILPFFGICIYLGLRKKLLSHGGNKI